MASEQRGERTELADISAGQPVYDADGNELGTVRGVDDAGFYVLAAEGAATVTLDEAREVFGRASVMWRCWACGAMGRIEGGLPSQCPDCEAPREDLYYWAED
ncbi:DUF7130 family rubredoxin-like protein [Halobaculum marinum]|uniref:DUF7130 domain-containing protein n=1 Tax=Halobaculum marinum TaxID=3031996 RepID=A0ABD5WX86_9EURY|nr:hypothetical protein [Halobaculum sp. DT55]